MYKIKKLCFLFPLILGCATIDHTVKDKKVERLELICKAICESMGWEFSSADFETKTCDCKVD